MYRDYEKLERFADTQLKAKDDKKWKALTKPKEDRKLLLKRKEINKTLRSKIEERFVSYFQKGIQEGVINPQHTMGNMLTIPSMVVGAIIMYTDPQFKTDIEVVIDSLHAAIIKLCN